MDFDRIAHDIVRDIILDSYSTRIKERSFHHSSDMRLLGVLYLIRDGMTSGELSSILGYSTPRTAHTLNRLEESGYIQRERGEASDKRTVYVFLTEEGKIDLAQKFEEFKEFIKLFYTKLGEKDGNDFLRLLSRIKQVLEEIDSESGKERQLQ